MMASGHPRSDAVCVCLPTSIKLKISHSAKKINHDIGKLRDGLVYFWVQSTQLSTDMFLHFAKCLSLAV